jgi:hypothetical protein
MPGEHVPEERLRTGALLRLADAVEKIADCLTMLCSPRLRREYLQREQEQMDEDNQKDQDREIWGQWLAIYNPVEEQLTRKIMLSLKACTADWPKDRLPCLAQRASHACLMKDVPLGESGLSLEDFPSAASLRARAESFDPLSLSCWQKIRMTERVRCALEEAVARAEGSSGQTRAP